MPNAYVTARAVRRIPASAGILANGISAAGVEWVAAINSEKPYPALYLAIHGATDTVLRLDINRLVDSLIGAHGAEQPWQPLERAEVDVDHYASYPGGPPDQIWGNPAYTVHMRHQGDKAVELSVHRRDRAPLQDWRHLQQIKDEVCGPDWEAIELYPAADRVVDTSNEYWLWCFPPGTPMWDMVRIFGFEEGALMTQTQLDAAGSEAVQRDRA